MLWLVLNSSNSEDQQSETEASQGDAGCEGSAAGSAMNSIALSQSCAWLGTEPALLFLPRSLCCWLYVCQHLSLQIQGVQVQSNIP